MLKFYCYEKCSSCRKALKVLDEHGLDYKKIPIREKPPTRSELRAMLKAYDGKFARLFNTSGGEYRSLGLKSKMPLLDDGQKISLLSEDGNLVKRPFVIGDGVTLVGFKPDEWDAALA